MKILDYTNHRKGNMFFLLKSPVFKRKGYDLLSHWCGEPKMFHCRFIDNNRQRIRRRIKGKIPPLAYFQAHGGDIVVIDTPALHRDMVILGWLFPFPPKALI